MSETPCVLVVDDHADIRTFLRVALERSGYEIQEAGTAHDAIRLLAEHTFDAVLTDWLMPGDGTELLMHLRRYHSGTAVVAMTGGSGACDLTALARTLGARYVLAKPFSTDELIVTMQAALAAKESLLP